ncbi:hypothetical protein CHINAEXTREME_16205 [Halobiforma lacisalsi AJ5]|uniref:Uncharacterized protein n=1 Tax=Natronobacterium lacisalsi AJ5 TaxID=358396 RepID=M0LFM1_NATLA|nr:hypothetical protein [Halobiforma lacisalsi]APW99218.1 hypothetical protein CHINAEXTREME_16205 [Halobiforma lacisalsi AJ5]EMA30785.1 hypothetical protein C445_15791 [Halobiforma lacisalsi AJ5]
MEAWKLYAVGLGLGLVGTLVTVVSLVLSGFVAGSVIVLGAAFTFAVSLTNVSRADSNRDHLLIYRIGNWVGAVIVIASGLLMLIVGILSFRTFV